MYHAGPTGTLKPAQLHRVQPADSAETVAPVHQHNKRSSQVQVQYLRNLELTKAVYCDGLVKLPNCVDLRHPLRLSWALVGAPQGLMLQEDALQAAGKIPVVDLVEALRSE